MNLDGEQGQCVETCAGMPLFEEFQTPPHPLWKGPRKMTTGLFTYQVKHISRCSYEPASYEMLRQTELQPARSTSPGQRQSFPLTFGSFCHDSYGLTPVAERVIVHAIARTEGSGFSVAQRVGKVIA